jgi:hypothetical protein
MRACPAGNGKGACACRLSGFQHPASAVAPRGHRCDEEAEPSRRPEYGVMMDMFETLLPHGPARCQRKNSR